MGQHSQRRVETSNFTCKIQIDFNSSGIFERVSVSSNVQVPKAKVFLVPSANAARKLFQKGESVAHAPHRCGGNVRTARCGNDAPDLIESTSSIDAACRLHECLMPAIFQMVHCMHVLGQPQLMHVAKTCKCKQRAHLSTYDASL